MYDFLITFRSVTYAQRGEKVLRGSGIDCLLRRTPRELSSRGCGYCLAVRGRDAMAAAALLRENGVDYGKVYGPGPQGRMEERTV